MEFEQYNVNDVMQRVTRVRLQQMKLFVNCGKKQTSVLLEVPFWVAGPRNCLLDGVQVLFILGKFGEMGRHNVIYMENATLAMQNG